MAYRRRSPPMLICRMTNSGWGLDGCVSLTSVPPRVTTELCRLRSIGKEKNAFGSAKSMVTRRTLVDFGDAI